MYPLLPLPAVKIIQREKESWASQCFLWSKLPSPNLHDSSANAPRNLSLRSPDPSRNERSLRSSISPALSRALAGHRSRRVSGCGGVRCAACRSLRLTSDRSLWRSIFAASWLGFEAEKCIMMRCNAHATGCVLRRVRQLQQKVCDAGDECDQDRTGSYCVAILVAQSNQQETATRSRFNIKYIIIYM